MKHYVRFAFLFVHTVQSKQLIMVNNYFNRTADRLSTLNTSYITIVFDPRYFLKCSCISV